MGRPAAITTVNGKADEVIERYANGETARQIAASMKLALSTVGRFLAGSTEESGGSLAERLARARKSHAAIVAARPEERYEEARAFLLEKDESGDFVNDHRRAAELTKLADKQDGYDRWIAGVIDPDTYGPRVDVKHSGEVSNRIVLGVPLQRPGGARLGAGDLGAARIAAEAEVVESTELVESGEAPRLLGESSPPTDEDVPE